MDHPLAEGTRVRMVPIPDEPNQPQEEGTVVSCDDVSLAWGLSGDAGFSYVVSVDGEFFTDDCDDGLRELTGDQIDRVL